MHHANYASERPPRHELYYSIRCRMNERAHSLKSVSIFNVVDRRKYASKKYHSSVTGGKTNTQEYMHKTFCIHFVKIHDKFHKTETNTFVLSAQLAYPCWQAFA